MTNLLYNLIIIGSGPAGLTAGIYASRANLEPLILEGKTPGGQLMGTTYVENWPGVKSILGPKLMMDMKDQAESLGCSFLQEKIVKVDFTEKPFTLWTDKNKKLKTKTVIIATGAVPNKLNCPGEQEHWGKGVTTCTVCDGAFYQDKPVIIVGGGDTAMEDASFMTKFTKDITIVQIMDKLTASYAMQKRVLENSDIRIMYNSTVSEIHGDGQTVNHATITNTKTGKTSQLPTNAVFIAIGLKPNTQFLQGHVDLDKLGYIKIKNGSKTSVDGVFAAGDVHDYTYKQAITSAGAGCMAALDAERYLTKNE